MKYGFKNISKVYQYYKKFIKKYRIIFIILLLLSSVSNIIELINPILAGEIIDNALNANMNKVTQIILIILILFFLNSFISFIYTYINNYIQNKTINDIKEEAFNKIIEMELECFNNNTIGKYISFLEGDTASISSFYVSAINSFLICITTIMITGYFILKISVQLSLVGILSIPIMFIVNIYFGRSIKKVQEKARQISDKYANNIQESFSGIMEIKGLSLGNAVKIRNKQNLDDLYQANLKRSTISSMGGLSQNLTGFLMQILIYYWGCLMIGGGNLSVGHFTAFNNYINKFLVSLQKISNINILFHTTLVSIDRYEKIILKSRQETFLKGKYGEKLKGNIKISNLVFEYKNTETKVFDGLNIEIKANELIAVVGSNGSGKTTLMNMLMRFYRQKSGEILFDNVSSLDIDLNTLRENITYIQQYPFLFNDTVRKNLLEVKKNATEEELIQVCREVCLYDIIMKMPKGFDTIIGETGVKLSGGQRQLLAIARGLLKNTKIFLLDEITSNVDSLTEKSIIHTIIKLSKNHTVLIATHRENTIIQMPRIVVLHNGKIIADGTHEELLEECSIYQHLFME